MTTTGNRAVASDPHGGLIYFLGANTPEQIHVRSGDMWDLVPEDNQEQFWAYNPPRFTINDPISYLHVRLGGANVYPFGTAFGSANDETDLRNRLDNVNAYYRRKAADVVMDKSAVRLLAKLYQSTTIDLPDLDTCNDGIALAKLAAARFCEIGSRAVQITETGADFIDSIRKE